MITPAKLATLDGAWPQRFLAAVNSRLGAGVTPFSMADVDAMPAPMSRLHRLTASRWIEALVRERAQAVERLDQATREARVALVEAHVAALATTPGASTSARNRVRVTARAASVAQEELTAIDREIATAEDSGLRQLATEKALLAWYRELDAQIGAWGRTLDEKVEARRPRFVSSLTPAEQQREAEYTGQIHVAHEAKREVVFAHAAFTLVKQALDAAGVQIPD